MTRHSDKTLDCMVIGGGPGGLTGAVYLGRFRRDFVVFDSGASRAAIIPLSHNHPGYPDGIAGRELVDRLRVQATRYGAPLVAEEVTALTRRADGTFEARTDAGNTWKARTVLLATGAMDVEAPVPRLAAAMDAGRVRYCPICDGYEALDRRIGVLGRGTSAIGEASFLRTYSDDVTVLSLEEAGQPDDEQRKRLRDEGLQLVEDGVTRFEWDDDGIDALTADGTRLRFETLYVALGLEVRSALARTLGADHAPDGALLTDDHQRTSVPGLYAAGDVVEGLDQISVAMGQAAKAATAIHNDLR